MSDLTNQVPRKGIANLKVKKQGAPALGVRPEQPIAVNRFPDQSRSGGYVPATIANVRFLLAEHRIVVRYNVIKKKIHISIPDHRGTVDNQDNVSLTRILSLATFNAMSTGLIPAYIEAIADENAFNPVADWIHSRSWDGQDRLVPFYETVTAHGDYEEFLKRSILRKWLLSAVAAAVLPTGFKSRGVLTLQGPQGIGKTSWGLRLVDDPILRDEVIKVDHHLDGSNKDSILTAVGHWIVEIGELDSSFRRDIARLKGFITSNSDKVRRPYSRADAEYPRRTVFFATVNERHFLVDPTGNSRWWTIPVEQLDYQHNIDMQQLYAQLAVQLAEGKEWWLNSEEESLLASVNSEHQSVSVVREKVLDFIDERKSKTEALTATEMLERAGFERPTNAQAKECGSVLRELFGQPKRIQGRDKWHVPVKSGFGADEGEDERSVRLKERFD